MSSTMPMAPSQLWLCLVNLELEYTLTHSYTKRHPKEAETVEWRIEGC